MSYDSVTIEDVEVEVTTDVEVRLSRIVAQVDLSDMLDEYGDNSATLDWVKENCSVAEVIDTMREHHGDEVVRREVGSEPPERLRADRAESVEGAAFHWRHNGATFAAAVLGIGGNYSIAVRIGGEVMHYAAGSLTAADMLVDALLNFASVES